MLRTILVLFPALAFAMPATSSADEPRWGGQQGYGQNVGKGDVDQFDFCADLLQGVTQNRACEVLTADECLAACDIAATGDDAARSCRSSCTAEGAVFCSTRWGGGYDQGVGKPGFGKPGFGKPVGPGQDLTPFDQEIEEDLVQEIEQDLEQEFGKHNVGKGDQTLGKDIEEDLEQMIEQELEQGIGKHNVGKGDQTLGKDIEQDLEQMVEQELEQGMLDTELEQEMVQELEQELEQGILDTELEQDVVQELEQELEQGIGKNIGKDHNIGKPGFGKRWGKPGYNQGFGKDQVGKFDQDLEQEFDQDLEQEFDQDLEQELEQELEQGIGKNIGKYDQNIGKPGFGKRWGKPGYNQGVGKGDLVYVECEMLEQGIGKGVGKGVGKGHYGK